ncbi:MAG: DUF167 domain-containing protein [Thermoanaerobaculales bacterium]
MGQEVEIFQVHSGARLRLRVKASARRERLVGGYGGALKIEVNVAPERGKANDAVLRLLAGELGVPLRALEITSGLSSQNKVVTITGYDSTEIASRLERLGLPARKGPTAGNRGVAQGG